MSATNPTNELQLLQEQLAESKRLNEEAKDAIGYMLTRIREHEYLPWYMLGTESYSLLIQSYADLIGMDREELERLCTPMKTSRDPVEVGKAIGLAMDPVDQEDVLPMVEPLDMEWPARDHESFFFPVMLLNEALETHGITLTLCSARSGHYQVKLGGVL